MAGIPAVDRRARGPPLFLEFDGVAMVSRAYCNGRLLGEHKGMFSRFSYLLTPHRHGRKSLAVHVSMEKSASTLALGEADG